MKIIKNIEKNNSILHFFQSKKIKIKSLGRNKM
jgi:hypothetical protein